MRRKILTPEIELSASSYRILRNKVEGLRNEILSVPEEGLMEIVNYYEMDLESYKYLRCSRVPSLLDKLAKIKTHDATRKEIADECQKLINVIIPKTIEKVDIKLASSI